MSWTKKKVILLHFITLIFVFLITIILYNKSYLPFYNRYDRFFIISDRIDIVKYSYSYIKNKNILGFGGNTLDQIRCMPKFKNEYKPMLPWPHTHNWLLETTLRYGIYAGFILLMYWVYVLFTTDEKKKQAMLIILLFLALFQTYMQELISLHLLLM
jgi:O-antigen ligase